MLPRNNDSTTSVRGNSQGNDTWRQILENLKVSVEQIQFNNWLINLKYLRVSDRTLFISSPTNFTRNWIIKNFFILIKEEARKVDSSIKKLLITVEKDSIVKTQTEGWYCGLPGFLSLNRKYTFKNFYICNENTMAHKMCHRIHADISTHQHHNIYFFYADVGMGKTHLLQSMALFLRKKFPTKRIEYLSAERFMYNFIHAVKNNSLFELREDSTKIDTYIIDDFHFICGKESTQKEFAFIINSLIERGKTVIISSMLSPYMLELNDQRTKSLLVASNVIHIKKLSKESRMRLLEFFNEKNIIKFDQGTLKLLANKVESSIRELEASIRNLTAYLTHSCKEPTLKNIHGYINNYVKSSRKVINFNDILVSTTKSYKISKSDLFSRKRTQNIVLARIVVAYLAKETTSMTLRSIGVELGNRNHATILYYIKRFIALDSVDQEFCKNVNHIKKSLRF